MSTLKYCAYSNTIRQHPQNYCIAYNRENRWICDPDLAADKELAVKVFKALFTYENKHQPDGNKLIEAIIGAKQDENLFELFNCLNPNA